MPEIILCNLVHIGYASILLAIVWLANFLLGLYYNVAIVHHYSNCKKCLNDVIRFISVCTGVVLLTVAISAFPRFISMVGLAVPDEYVEVTSVLAIITIFAKGIYEYTARAMKKLDSILKSELEEDDDIS